MDKEESIDENGRKIHKKTKKKNYKIFHKNSTKKKRETRVPSFYFCRNGIKHEVRAAGIIPFIKLEESTYYLAWIAKKWSQINIPGGKIDFCDIIYRDITKETKEVDYEGSIRNTALRESIEESNDGLNFLKNNDLNFGSSHYMERSKYIIFLVEITTFLDVTLLGYLEDTEKGLIAREYVWLPEEEVRLLKKGQHPKYKLYFEGIFDFIEG
jgi:hypothetical protein